MLIWSTVTEDRRSVVIARETDAAVLLEPLLHAVSSNREYLLAAPTEDVWWVVSEIDGHPSRWSYFPSKAAAKDQAEEWERGQ
jgi:hypothetical protein